MTRIRFENSPSTKTPINADNLNKLNNVIISSTEPTTGEEVWIQKSADKKIYVKNNGVYEEFSKGEEDTGWVTLELLNGCTHKEWNPLKARMKNGIVTIMGMVDVPSATWDKQIAVIPEMFRPCEEINAICRGAGGFDRGYIVAFNKDGRLSYLTNVNKNISNTNADVSISIFATYIAG